MSTFSLKIIAIITMLIDHISAVLLPSDSWFYIVGRLIGRLALPIFVFLIVEGFFHTSNIKKYLTRLGVFALVSELPFDLVFYNSNFEGANIKADIAKMFTDPQVFDLVIKRFMSYQNIFFTLFIGLMAIWILSMIEKKYYKNMLYVNILNALVTLVFCFIAGFLRTDYGFTGVLLIVAFYLFRGSKALLTISLIILSTNIYQVFSVLAMGPIAFYNGEKGKSVKYFFYAFYPVHLLILYVLLLII